MWASPGKLTTATDARRAAVGSLVLFIIIEVAAIVLMATGHSGFGGVALPGALLFAIYGGRCLLRYRELR